MADIGTLSLGAYDSGNSTMDGIVGTTPPDSGWDISTASDSSYVHDNDNTTNDEIAYFAFENTPADFDSILTLSVQLRYWRDANTADKNWSAIEVEILSAVAGTRYAGNAGDTGPQVVVGTADGNNNITNTTAANSSVTGLTITSAGSAASKSSWDGAVVSVHFDRTKVKGGNTDDFIMSALELTGTYTATASDDESLAFFASRMVGGV